MKAKDLMVPLHDYLRPDNTLKEAANLLRTARRGEEKVGVKGLPVLDENRKLIGILSIGDILKVVYPEYLYLMDLGSFTWDGMVEALARKMADRKVRDFMTKIVITIKEDSPLMECIDHMVKNNVKRVPVLDRENRVVGMLYERDIFYYIAKAMLNN